MFGLFATPRTKVLKREKRFFRYQFEAFCKMSDSQIGLILDRACKIKLHSMSQSEKAVDIYVNPFAVSEQMCLDQLNIYHQKMKDWLNEAFNEARHVERVPFASSSAYEMLLFKQAALSIWCFSLAAGCLPEFRENGAILWNQLKRGFPYCAHFDPEKDALRGFLSS
jgi:hypothetical protein